MRRGWWARQGEQISHWRLQRPQWWLYHTETLVLQISPNRLVQGLDAALATTAPLPHNWARPAPPYRFRFWGVVKPDSFRLYTLPREQALFAPLVLGRIEPTSQGCLVLVRYRLFPDMRFLLGMGACILAVLLLLFGTDPDRRHYALIAAMVSLAGYIGICLSFAQQCRIHQKNLHQLVNHLNTNNY
jgi:hypothetical protein